MRQAVVLLSLCFLFVAGCRTMEDPVRVVAERDTGEILANALGTEDVEGLVSGLASAGIQKVDRAALLGSGMLGVLSDEVEYEVHLKPDGAVKDIRNLETGKVWDGSGRGEECSVF